MKAIEVPPLPKVLPPITNDLLVPCYEDLMPEMIQGRSVRDVIINDADNHAKYSKCYRRQWKLIQEVKAREQG